MKTEPPGGSPISSHLRSFWPFPLKPIQDAVERCDELLIQLDQEAPIIQPPAFCAVCRKIALDARPIIVEPLEPLNWFIERGRRDDGHTICYPRIPGRRELLPFCSQNCYANAVLWSLYEPMSPLQSLIAPLFIPVWAIQNTFGAEP